MKIRSVEDTEGRYIIVDRNFLERGDVVYYVNDSPITILSPALTENEGIRNFYIIDQNLHIKAGDIITLEDK